MDRTTENIVNDQYEQYPYPERNPLDERKRLNSKVGDDLLIINSLGFKGNGDFENMRVLVAGGGTGDATIYLAEQLRSFPDAHVVYCDLSKTSLKIAKERAAERNLNNITWLNRSLFDLTEYSSSFDFISCSGVLHHLEDPDAGLKSLRDLLKPNGIMSIMLYAKYGRTAVYQIQELMRIIAGDNDDLNAKVNLTKVVVEELPESNAWEFSKEFITDFHHGGDAGVVDLFLHSQDRAYTVDELYELIQNSELNLVDFIMPHRYELLPEGYGIKGELLDLIKSYPKQRQQAIIELYSGGIFKHACYLSKNKDTRADPYYFNNIPFFHKLIMDRLQLADQIDQGGYKNVTANVGNSINVTFQIGKYTTEIMRCIDGINTIGDIFSAVKDKFGESSSADDIEHDFIILFKTMNEIDVLLLRNKNCVQTRESEEIQQYIEEMYS